MMDENEGDRDVELKEKEKEEKIEETDQMLKNGKEEEITEEKRYKKKKFIFSILNK